MGSFIFVGARSEGFPHSCRGLAFRELLLTDAPAPAHRAAELTVGLSCSQLPLLGKVLNF